MLFFWRSLEHLPFVNIFRAKIWTLFIGCMWRSRVRISILFIFGRGALNLNVHYSYIYTGIKDNIHIRINRQNQKISLE
jgi:hypothetical protein